MKAEESRPNPEQSKPRVDRRPHLHALERELDRLENEERQAKKYYAKESRKFQKQLQKQEVVVRRAWDKAHSIDEERRKVVALLANVRRKEGYSPSDVVPGGCTGDTAEDAEFGWVAMDSVAVNCINSESRLS